MISPLDRLPTASLPGRSCLDDDDLNQLVNESLPSAEHAAVVQHLDQCENCRARLETVAGQQDQWQAVAKHLNPTERDLSDSKLPETLRSLKDETREIPPARASRNESPAELPGNGRIADRYQIQKVLGQGGMGIVYLAFDEKLRRKVAIKLINGPLASRPEAQRRIEREAIAAAAIRSEHVVAIHHIDHLPSGPYLVMEYIAGTCLEARLATEKPLPVDEIVRIGIEIASGLEAAHARGLIHRDVKPGNVLLEEETGKVKLTDFGLVRSLDDSGLSREEMISGTPEYIAPEQAAGRKVDRRADLYSLGCVLYALCTGHPPFQDANPMAILRQTQIEPHAPIHDSRPEVPSELCAVIDRLLQKDPAERYQDTREVTAALEGLRGKIGAVTNVAPVAARPHGVLLPLFLSAILLMGMVALGTGVANGWGNFDDLVNQLAGEKALPSPEAAPPADRKETPKEEPTDAEPLPVQRIQVVTPEQLMKERIQNEKDKVEREASPLLAQKLVGHTGPVQDFVFTPDGKSLISCSGWPTGDRTIRVWDLASGEETRRFDTSTVPQDPTNSGTREAPGEIYALAITPDGKKLISTGTGGAVCVWDVESGKMIGAYKEHTSTVYSVAISPDGSKVLTGGRDSVARLWNLRTQETLMELKGHQRDIRTVTFSPDGKQALTCSLDKTLRLWDLEAAKQLHVMKPDNQWVNNVQFSSDGTRAVSLSGSSIDLWDLKTGKRIHRLQGQGSPLTTVAWSADGRLLATGGYGGRVGLWDVDSGKSIETLLGHRSWIWRVKFTPDGTQVVSAGGGRHASTGGVQAGPDCVIRVWDLPKIAPRVASP